MLHLGICKTINNSYRQSLEVISWFRRGSNAIQRHQEINNWALSGTNLAQGSSAFRSKWAASRRCETEQQYNDYPQTDNLICRTVAGDSSGMMWRLLDKRTFPKLLNIDLREEEEDSPNTNDEWAT